MSTPIAVTRTAPIPIAPKPSSSRRTVPSRQGSAIFEGSSFHPHSLSGLNSPGSDSPLTGSAAGASGSHLQGPCDACLRRRIKCIMSDDGVNGVSGDDDEQRSGGGGGGGGGVGSSSTSNSCISCQANGVDCSLAESPQPRKRKLNGNLTEVSHSKRSSPGRSDNNHTSRRRRQHQSSLSSTAASSSFIEEMANFGGPTLLKRTLGLQRDRYSQYIGPTTDFEPSLINLSPFDPHDESLLARGTLRKVSDNDTFLLLPDYNTTGHEHQVEDVEAIERLVSPHGKRLITLYFRVVHPCFPIIQKHVFFEKYERDFREFSPPLLAAIYILAINWWDHDKELARLPKPNVRELERLVRITLADAMYRPKLSTVQAGLLLSQRPEGDQWAPTAQLVAIAQELGLHLDASAWKIPPWEKGLRKRLAWALYMQDKWGALVHGRPSHIFAANWAVQPLVANDFPDEEWEEKRGNDGDRDKDIDDDDDDDDNDEGDVGRAQQQQQQEEEERLEIERGRVLFVQMVHLSQILAETLETFYSLQAMQNVANAGMQGTHLVLSLAKPIQIKLKEWHSALPASVRMDSSNPSSASLSSMAATGGSSGGGSSTVGARLSSIGYLHLAYFATEITLHRRIIRSLAATEEMAVRSMGSGPGGGMGAGMGAGMGVGAVSPSPGAGDPYVQRICRNAAKARLISAMDFVNRLTPGHLRAFWYFASKTNFALIGTFGSLLWATSPGREEAEWYRRRLGEYRWTLSVSSKPGEGRGLTEFAMGMLDISTGLLKKLPEKPSLSRSASVADGMDDRVGVVGVGGGAGGGAGGPGGPGGRRHSLLSLGMGGGARGATDLTSPRGGGPPDVMMTGVSSSYSGGGMQSGDVSGMQSPLSGSGDGDGEGEYDSSDEGMYGMFPAGGSAPAPRQGHR